MESMASGLGHCLGFIALVLESRFRVWVGGGWLRRVDAVVEMVVFCMFYWRSWNACS